MASESDVQVTECGDADDKNGSVIGGSNAAEVEPTDGESEDEDVDFNPFLKESPSEEACSSLSSDVEGLDADDANSHGGIAIPSGTQPLPKVTSDCLGCDVGVPKDEGTDDSHKGACDEKPKKSDSVSILEENGTTQEKENGLSSGTDAVEDAPQAQITMTNSRKPIIDLDNEDAICKRTRARYSLAGFTLDELETFLQETDDEDDIQNVDEEEEYRKFLAAVLQSGNGDDQQNLEGNDEDDDEDNDADFEIEIEEALESDVDDCLMTSNKDEEIVRSSRRPQTRQNRRKKVNVQNKRKLTEKGKRQLRPLLPVTPAATATSISSMGARSRTLETFPHSPSCAREYQWTGFAPHQIGQLYCLIYEHVQLLIQLYSLAVLEPSRQHVASQVKGLLSELLHKRDIVLAWRSTPYPSSCFLPSYVHPSVSDENKTCVPVEDSAASSQGNDGQGCRWLMSVGGPVLSVLDVAPLKLVGRYIEEVSNAVREHQRRCVETTNNYLEKQPLFPLLICPPISEVSGNNSKGDGPSTHEASAVPNPNVPKKTLAATLVESTKKQSVALVPRQIAKLAQPFMSLFNPALFPHKAPPSSVANRVLFTDAEDELLAMGIMEYNNDWKAIRQRFLPCKSEHQIFVRAKNRCSSKAPENPIKTVRKMKTSPLTEEEKARIHEGLNTFKLDWTSIWKFIVPYRDPNLLCRQWRIAVGTQKSYKGDSTKKEKRRLYESNRRRCKATTVENSLTGSEKEDDQTEFSGGQNGSGEDCVENDNEAYLHEAFLADWRPTSSAAVSSKVSASGLKSRCVPGDLSGRFCEVQEGTNNHRNQTSQFEKGRTHEGSAAPEDSNLLHCNSFQPLIPHSYAPSKSISKAFVSESLMRSHKNRKRGISNLVKLAPELPPVKLPPAVRIIPQEFLRSSQPGPSTVGTTTGSGLQNAVCDPTVVNGTSNLLKPVQDTIVNPTVSSISSQKCGLLKNGCPTNETGSDLDPQMHPLLFRTLEEGHLPSYSLNTSSRIPTFSFFPVSNLALQNPHPASPLGGRLKSFKSNETAPTSSGLDFHPLLQRTNNLNISSLAAGPTDPILSTDLELSRDGFMEDNIVYHAGAAAAQMAAATSRAGPSADANDLDLDIQLSSASRKRKVANCEGAEVDPAISSVNAANLVEGVKEKTDIHCQYLQPVGHNPPDPVTNRHTENSASANSAMLLPNLDSFGACMNDNVGDQPLLGIVMEQEELSDSDVEMEGVEFECEEMADSEGEGSDNEQIVSAHNKEQAESGLSTDSHCQLSKAVPCEAFEGFHTQKKGRTPRSDTLGPGKGSTRSSWLSLNSHHCSPQSRTKSAHCSAEGSSAPLHPNRHYKKAVLSTKNTQPGKPGIDMSQSGPSPPSLRKSKRQTSKHPSPLRTDLVVENANCIEKDGKV